MKRKLKKYLSSDTTKDLAKISIGKIGNAAFAFSAGIIIARHLGPADFGLFTLSLSVLIITLELTGSEAIDNGVVRFASFFLKDDPDKANLLFKVAMKVKLLAVSVVLLAGLLVAKPLLAFMIEKSGLYQAMLFGLLGGCCASLWRYILAILQSHQRFTEYALVNIFPNLLKVSLFFLCIWFGALNLFNVLSLNVLTVFFGFAIGLLFVPRDFFFSQGDERGAASQLLNFSKWIIITNLIFALYSRLDIFMLTYFKDTRMVGIYSVALAVISVLDLIYVTMLTKFLPHVSQFIHREEFLAQIRKSLKISLFIALLVLPLYFIAEPLILLAYSEEFMESIAIFRILLAGFFFGLLFNPLLVILYARHKQQIMTFIYLALLIIHFCGSLYIVPKYGAWGAAAMVSATKAMGGILILFFVYKEVSYENS